MARARRALRMWTMHTGVQLTEWDGNHFYVSFFSYSLLISMVSLCPSAAVANNSTTTTVRWTRSKKLILLTIGKYKILFIYSDWTVLCVRTCTVDLLRCGRRCESLLYDKICFSRSSWSIVTRAMQFKGIEPSNDVSVTGFTLSPPKESRKRKEKCVDKRETISSVCFLRLFLLLKFVKCSDASW